MGDWFCGLILSKTMIDANNISNRKAGYLRDKDTQVAIETTKKNCVSYPGIKSDWQKFYDQKLYKQAVKPLLPEILFEIQRVIKP